MIVYATKKQVLLTNDEAFDCIVKALRVPHLAQDLT